MQKSIVIDATHLESECPTGVEQYTFHLVPLISEILVKSGVRVYWLGHKHHTNMPLPKGVYWQYSPYKKGWGQLYVPSLLKHMRAGAYFTPSGIAPVKAPCPVAMTVHDISVYDSPESYSIAQKIRLTYLNKIAAKSCKALIVPSTYTKKQIKAKWEIPEERIFVTPLAAETDPIEPEPIKGIGTELPMVVFMGRIETKKNLKPVLQAMACAPIPDFQLVLAGKAGVGSHELYSLLPALKEGGRQVAVPGFLNKAQRSWLYQNASVMVVPGLHEGFGLPVLEAFVHGIPCICSEAGSLPEVGGDASLYIKEQTPQAWREAIDLMVHDSELRNKLSAKASERAKKYTWKHTAELTAKALETLLTTN